MKTIVLDDDPTGTQSASDVTVLFDATADTITDALRTAQSVYIQTNSRAIDEGAARNLVAAIHRDGIEAGHRLGTDIRFVLRGDSTLRGHVFAETEEFLTPESIILFVPSFPDGGRTTLEGTHYVNVGGKNVPAHESEYADDPVFPFNTSVLVDYVQEKSGRLATAVALDGVRSIAPLVQAIKSATPGSVILPDAVTDEDIRCIAAAVEQAIGQGASVVVRCASPLAAMLAGVASQGLLQLPVLPAPEPTLLICGSHTAGASGQIATLEATCGKPLLIDTETALNAPEVAGQQAAASLRGRLNERGLAIVASSRDRSAEHNTLHHGKQVMTALTSAVSALRSEVRVVIAKGGITSAEVARTGLAASQAYVMGQILPGVSLWRIDVDGAQLLYVVVPGNVGDDNTLLKVIQAFGFAVMPASVGS